MRKTLTILRFLLLAFAFVAGGVRAPAHADSGASVTAAEKTVVLAIDNMTCPTCPITVRHAIKGVDGVISAEVDFAAGTATVVFDPEKTDIATIAAASTNAGYPARPAGE
ncbi:MAG: heavy-metal-associated domain-containing protein [Rhodothalassiaceae bacterium]